MPYELPKRINSIKELRHAIENDENEFFILLAGGFARSSKNIHFHDSLDKNKEYKFSIINEIDDSEQILSESEIMDQRNTNIGKAMKQGAFYAY
jgi:hypothetical protein